MTGNKQQEKYCRKHKHVETKQHATKQPYGTGTKTEIQISGTGQKAQNSSDH